MLVVREPFHLDGVMRTRGYEPTAAESKKIEADPELLRRCVRNDSEPSKPAKSSSASEATN